MATASLKNGTIAAGGVAQDALDARLGRSQVIVSAQTEDMWVNFGTNAATDVGELVYQGSSSVFSVWRYPEVGGRMSIVSPTTGAKYQIRDT